MSDTASNDSAALRDQQGVDRATPYAWYALLLLALANMFNYLDRHIVSALAPAIKADLKLDDADIGFLLGTAFAVLYGVLGIAMGRIADALSRTKLMASGLALWSVMTGLSGGAMSFATLSAARLGVGVGEATANPVAQSMLSDYFPARKRGTVLGVYLASVHLGHAAALILGGLFLANWSSMCGVFPNGSCEIASWRAAFLIVGLPGLVLAVLVLFLREPPRPQAHVARPALEIVRQEIGSAIPPFTLFSLGKLGGSKAVQSNLLLIAALAVIGGTIAAVTGDYAQWIAVAIGVYSVTTWSQILRHGDAPLYKLTFGCPTFMLMMFGGALLACFVGTIATWAMPYAIRTLGGDSGTIGLALGGDQRYSGWDRFGLVEEARSARTDLDRDDRLAGAGSAAVPAAQRQDAGCLCCGLQSDHTVCDVMGGAVCCRGNGAGDGADARDCVGNLLAGDDPDGGRDRALLGRQDQHHVRLAYDRPL